MGDIRFYNQLRQNVRQLGVDEKHVKGITQHSFRSGGATDYLLAGCAHEWIKQQGRWNSDAFLIYLRTTHASIDVRAKLLAAPLLTQGKLIPTL